ncbi:MAG: ATP phosphoribosyltransferase regulatory subunit [Geothrix sp.]|jgi:ATP phosphoribosyltransferase regulatory subunit HisZ|uniref:ATP phosphoribosyltransferase regulatory subunit n=1 Tax=Candidatus Geothrix odensensis TaxID=2954440 RepID=A0A936EZE4_9BACT|nr:ATP phosphoribosyltransferase regulatory subunit [Holophagaceae bacterium]MBK8571182.1 ATP phosphoribosyltransferase regulatory subunit [Candidatus Geothrix odensensis]MBP7617723.1 ATP phosphoribosyltransferase regulatory subunit [Geothrix sp.]MCC6512888.1 ATP phosphoribosyltransferase regulatory subunit [Geothrix sp.]
MPVRTPHFPDLLFGSAARLRRWEAALMGLLAAHGYRELHPSLVLRESIPEGALRFFDGDELVALRWDFTVALAGLLARGFAAPPDRVAYAGAVFRRPIQPWEAVERFEVGCERIQPEGEPSDEADVELACLLMAIPGAIGLKNAILHLGHAALVRRPLEAEGLFGGLADEVVAALSRRAPHRVREVLKGHPSAARLTAHAEALLSELDGPGTLNALGASPYAHLLEGEREHMDRALKALLPILPANLELRVDLADVAGLGFYTGPTLRLWAPGAQQELAAGGRYDRLFPDLGRPWQAAGFCVRLSRLLDLAETRPDLFEPLP